MSKQTKDSSRTTGERVPEMSTVGVRTRSRWTAVAQPTDPVPAAVAVSLATEAPATVPVGSTNPAAKKRTRTKRTATLVAAGPILEKAPVPKRRVTKPLVPKKGKSTASNRKWAALQETDSELDTADAINYDGESVRAQTLQDEYEELMQKMGALVARGQPTTSSQVPPVSVVPAVR